MSLKDIMNDDLDIFFNTDDFAETVTYKPKFGASKEVVALVDLLNEQEIYESGIGQGQYDVAHFELRASEVTPKKYDEISYNGKDWKIRKILTARDSLSYQVFATSNEKAAL